MFEGALILAIAATLGSALWAIFVINRVNLAEATGGASGPINQLLTQVPVLFILVNLLYALPLPIRCVFTQEVEGDISPQLGEFIGYLPFALLLQTTFQLVFATTYRARIRSRRNWRAALPWRMSGPWFALVWGMLALISGSLVYALATEVGGVLALILMGYRVTEQFVGKGHLAVGFEWAIALAVILLSYAVVLRRRLPLLLAAGVILLEMLAFGIMGRRGMILVLLVSALAVVHFGHRALSWRALLGLGLAGFLALNLMGLLRGDSYDDVTNLVETLSGKYENLHEEGDDNYFYALSTGNFAVPFESFPQVIRRLGDIMPQLGMTLLRGVALIVPNALWEDRPLPLSNWYMQEFYGGAAMNEGRQFFFLSESYLNFGPLGPLLWGWLYGTLMAATLAALARRLRHPIMLALVGLLIGNMLNFVSSDFIGGLLSFIKGYGVPVISFLLAGWVLAQIGRRPRGMHV